MSRLSVRVSRFTNLAVAVGLAERYTNANGAGYDTVGSVPSKRRAVHFAQSPRPISSRWVHRGHLSGFPIRLGGADLASGSIPCVRSTYEPFASIWSGGPDKLCREILVENVLARKRGSLSPCSVSMPTLTGKKIDTRRKRDWVTFLRSQPVSYRRYGVRNRMRPSRLTAGSRRLVEASVSRSPRSRSSRTTRN